ncbi:hypothetical protein FHG87_014158 [Trinorchestia longiramus]|nr:hypothetical protein FHG87_014158 [Trinorchestia longiramus]
MAWKIISSAGSVPNVLHGRVNAEAYEQFLRRHVLLPDLAADIQPPIFAQNYAPCHTAKKLRAFSEDEEVALMSWPPQSPDIKLIENVWKVIRDRTRKKNNK